MKNPFERRSPSLDGPATDILPVTPDDAADLPAMAIALYVEGGGDLALVTPRGEERQVSVPDFFFLPVGTRRVRATGTTASGIHALVFA
ncbi:spike base protein, RCAP_Rcc01079 family [Rhodovulum adriaticum]|uniref:Uncharacterized protein n=1 Tax=Rhodovulum adriaticum TaxID=35804 RepID=A0A4V2SMH0_RHOAD|nr:hypothetical protein [Rhodovulum adriaticum]MBK1634213.1 hypothetical protein [Rhodovulum adriaticum]TCP27236.1 hypothetical protein EV656_101139 [Rhodovulum adriaticum]